MGRPRRKKDTGKVQFQIADERPLVADRTYRTRKIYFRGQATVIICHEDEPSAVVALCNALLLCGMRLAQQRDDEVSEAELIATIQGLLEASFKQLSAAGCDFTLQQLHEYSLKLGGEVDPNVNFSGTMCFGDKAGLFGGEVKLLFPLLGIILYHGWIIDPQDVALINFVKGKSHTQLQSKLKTYNDLVAKCSDIATATREKWARVAELLEGDSLTAHGLLCLRDDIKEDISVLYWRKHFHTVLKYNGNLYLLQTNKHFLGTEVVWKHLAGTNGEGELLTCYLTTPESTISFDGKSLSFVNFLMEPNALVADQETSWVHSLYQSAAKRILADTDTTKSEWYLKTLWAELNRDETNIFYQSVCEIIKAQTDSIKGREYLSTAMKIHNDVLAESAKQGIQDHALEQVTAILQMNRHVAKMVGEPFDLQIHTIFNDMMLIYSNCIKRITRTGKPDDHLRCVTREVLNLLNTFLSEAQGSQTDLVVSLMDNPEFAYGNSGQDRTEMEYLSLFETIVNRCSKKMHVKVLQKITEILNDISMQSIEVYKYPELCLKYLSLIDAITTQCFNVLTADSCERLEYVMDFIIGSLCQTEKGIDEDAFHILYRILEEMKPANFKNNFYKKYFSKIGEEIIKVLIRTHDHNELFLVVLQHLFDGVSDLSEYISDIPPQVTALNTMFIRDNVMQFMKRTFPNITTSKAGTFVDGLLTSSNDLLNILNHVREAFVPSREQVDHMEASVQEVSRTTESTDLSLGTISREQMPSSKTAPFASILPSKSDPRLVNWFQRDFLPAFTKMNEPVPFYKREVHSMFTRGSKVLRIKFCHLIDHDPEMAIEICNCYDRIEKKLKNAAIAFILSEADENLFPRLINLKVLIVDVPLSHSVVLFTEFIKTSGNEIIKDRTILRAPNAKQVQEVTPIGRIAYSYYSRQFTSVHARGMAWDGALGLKHFVVVNNNQFRICKQAYVGCDYQAKKQNWILFGSRFIPLFGDAALFESLAADLKEFLPPTQFSLEMEELFHLFVTTHLAGKFALLRSSFWPKLQKIPASLSNNGRLQWNKVLKQGFFWIELVKADPNLKELYNYNPNEKGQHDKTVNERSKKSAEATLVHEVPEGAILAPEGAPAAPDGVLQAPVGVPVADRDYGDTVYNPSLLSLLDFLRTGTEHLHWGNFKGQKRIERLIDVDLLLSKVLPVMIEIMRALLFSPEMTDEIRDALVDVFYLYDLIEPEASDERRTVR